MSFDYGNARIACRRARRLDRATLARLAGAGSTAEFLAALERSEDWRPILRQVAPLGADAGQAIDAAIERHRAERLAALPGMFEPPARRLVEALVMPLDAERAIAVLRRRHAGASAESIGATIVAGALLRAADLGRLARVTTDEAAMGILADAGLVLAGDAKSLATAMSVPHAWDQFEEAFAAAVDRSRLARASGRGAAAARVRDVIERERADRAAVAEAIAAGGMAAGVLIERTATLERLDDLARAARREPLGIGPVVAEVAAVEAQAIRLRAALVRVRAGWSPELARPYLGWGSG